MADEKRLELWGGVECTVARIGDRFTDQVRDTGHRDRSGDLDLIAGLGIRTLRYPIIWETVSPNRPDDCDWTWHDERLAKMRGLGIAPIAGLVHHGSGPRYTSLLDPNFPRLVARHAERVARRYPWITHYTPVNEPVTTARFSALYGHWYPHARDERSFLTALVQQCRATVLAMRAIRRVNPNAKLVQTDDLGRTFSTPDLDYQAGYENERRWLSFDLLSGRVDRHHPFWPVLRDHGASTRELSTFLEGDCIPDIIGINHYLTSERFLDPRTDRYPPHLVGSNAFGQYADVEAVRMPIPESDIGPAARLREVWERYRRPIAVTEVHHGCTRDEQLRWLSEVWRAAETVRSEGADIRAVTVWALLGTTDWNTLLTRQDGIYEPGAFDVRGPAPRPTAIAKAATSLARTGGFAHPVLDTPGWWKRDERFYPSVDKPRGLRRPDQPRPILILAGPGDLGRTVARIAAQRGLEHALLPHKEVGGDVTPETMLANLRPWAVLDVTAAERGPALRAASSRSDRAAIAARCAADGIRYVGISTATVFDGRSGRPGRESDPVSFAAAAAEEAGLVEAAPEALLIRSGPLFSPWASDPLVWQTLHDVARGRLVKASPHLVSPTYAPDLVHVALDLLVDGESGLWHLANPGSLDQATLVGELARRAGLVARTASVSVIGQEALCFALQTERGVLMPPLGSALDRFVADCKVGWDLTRDVLGIAAE
jgi:dTDP-4-dehydrorhamnose reductase